VVRTLDPVSGAVLSKSSANAPPKPMNKAPHEVKETTDVKRNRAQLPSQLIHAKPTTGDWLKKRYIVNNYILLDVLGVGSYGEVRMCKDRTTDQLYAIKIFSKDMLKKKKNGNTVETYFEDIRREIAIMKKLLHPNVLRLFEVLDDPNVNKMYLVLEYMKKGDLIAILKTRGEGSSSSSGGAGGGAGADKVGGVNGDKDSDPMKSGFVPLSDFELWNIFRQVAAGVRYLHYQNIVHGDIKPQNLLVGEDGVVKIADFGM
jgi:[calcium/calmodulin-dependent protein kinase] kinase